MDSTELVERVRARIGWRGEERAEGKRTTLGWATVELAQGGGR